MLSAILSSSNAMGAFQSALNNTSNNIANMNTTAFKRNSIQFSDLMSDDVTNTPAGAQAGRILPRGFAQGAIITTNREQDLAINGRGFFVVQSENGTMKYTRDGSFVRDANGRLATSGGLVVQPPITVPADTITMSITPDGTVTVMTSSKRNVTQTLGQIQLANFQNQELLTPESGNLWVESEGSGPPTISAPGTSGTGTLKQACLEQSNVDLTQELTQLVSTQQAFAANSKAVNTTMNLLGSGLGLFGQ